MEEKIVFEAEDGTQEEFYIVEQTKLNGVTYLLAADSQDEDAECFLFKDMSRAEDEDALYIPVEDDTELDAVLKVFSELLEDITIEN